MSLTTLFDGGDYTHIAGKGKNNSAAPTGFHAASEPVIHAKRVNHSVIINYSRATLNVRPATVIVTRATVIVTPATVVVTPATAIVEPATVVVMLATVIVEAATVVVMPATVVVTSATVVVEPATVVGNYACPSQGATPRCVRGFNGSLSRHLIRDY
ncbi:MAG TPA: hypothetical protein VF708_06130 [Pyrinomonadaceae bacterium]